MKSINIKNLHIGDGSTVQIGQDNKNKIGQDNKNIINNINSEKFFQESEMLIKNKTQKQRLDIIKKIKEYADNGLAIGKLVKKFIALLS